MVKLWNGRATVIIERLGGLGGGGLVGDRKANFGRFVNHLKSKQVSKQSIW